MVDQIWKLFLGNGRSSALEEMPEAPSWRSFMSESEFQDRYKDQSDRRWHTIQALAKNDLRGKERGESFHLDDAYTDVLNAVNAALYLRRPLLVTGKPGSGKTSLAYAVAHELQLGAVLSWPVNSRSNIMDALYRYDAVARLQDAQLKREKEKAIGEYVRLGPVGTAFLPSHLPRVLLIDEVDKCDINLPNDLLNLFEEGQYEIPELVRYKSESESVEVRTSDADAPATINAGRVVCHEFPFVVMTSNGERDFPPAFLRRCLRLRMADPSQNRAALERIVEGHLKRGNDEKRWSRLQEEASAVIQKFVTKDKAEASDIATDQLLNVVYLLTREVKPDQDERSDLESLLLKGLNEEY